MSEKKRARTDTFWHYKPEENASYFNTIYSGQSDVYYLDVGATKLDYKGRKKYCWRVHSKATGKPASGLRSTRSYRLALLWSVYSNPSFWKHPKKLEALKAALPAIETKQGDHSRHLCGNQWCCNPRHIKIGSRKANEIDKHYHYFLNHEDQSVRDRFLQTFPDLLKQEGLW